MTGAGKESVHGDATESVLEDKSYRQIPGTVVFDAKMARLGYHLNQFCMSLMAADSRRLFAQDERAYLNRWPVSEVQKEAVLNRDYSRMIELGGNIYFLGKIIGYDKKSFAWAAAQMSGMSEPDYESMMLCGGRSPDWTTNAPEVA